MAGVLGVCRSIDRVNGVVNFVQDGEHIAKPAQYLGDPPPPLTRCEFTPVSSGKFICRGPLCNTRVILHDDFVNTASQYGDTPWRRVQSAPFATGQATNLGAGVLYLQPVANTATGVAKDTSSCVAPTGTQAYWISCRVATNLNTSDCLIGLSSDTLSDRIDLRGWGQAGTMGLETTKATVGTTVNTATSNPANNVFITLDMIYTATWAAGWVNTDGPYVSTTNIPTAATTPYWYSSIGGAAGSLQAYCDWYHLEKVDAVIDQTLLTSILAGA